MESAFFIYELRIMNRKICAKCKKPRALSEFCKDRARKDGHSPICRVCASKKHKEWRFANPGWNDEAKANEVAIRWYYAHHETAKAGARLYQAKILQTEKGRLNSNLRRGILRSLHGEKARRSWESLVDFTIDQLKRHLEKLFKSGMTWENYGTAWEIDHKIPKAVFNFENPEDVDFRICWSLKNLQPLGKSENRKKQAKVDEPFQPSLRIAI